MMTITDTGEKIGGYMPPDALAKRLSGEGYDGVFASEMLRTEQTAAPVAKALGEQVTVLPGQVYRVSSAVKVGRALTVTVTVESQPFCAAIVKSWLSPASSVAPL